MDHQKKIEKDALDACLRYWKLSRLLFSGKSWSILNAYELKEGDEFYKECREISDEIGIVWEEMTPEQSDAVLMALLESLFQKMNLSPGVDVVISVKVHGNT